MWQLAESQSLSEELIYDLPYFKKKSYTNDDSAIL